MDLEKITVIQSTNKAVKMARVLGSLDLQTSYTYDMLNYYIDFLEGNDTARTTRDQFKTMLEQLKNNNPGIICNFKNVLPITELTGTGNSTPIISNNPKISNITVASITQETLFGIAPTFYVYRFKKSDFLSTYTDSNDQKFHSLVIFRSDLQDGGLRYRSSPTGGNVYGESGIPLEVLFDDIEKWSFYTDSTSIFIHQLSFKVIDRIGGTDYSSNTATLEIDRTANNVSNQPATFGDYTTVIDHGDELTITLEMVTSSLTPPYNDPEGDLIDAIRLVEISTANKGVFKLNNIPVIEMDVITREQLENNEFKYTSPSGYNEVWGDVFRFQGRDEGSGIWVD